MNKEGTKFYVSLEEIARYLVRMRKIYPDRVINTIHKDFNSKEEFLDFINEPKRCTIQQRDSDQIPNHCGICRFYGDPGTFDMDVCSLYDGWPKKTAYLSYCDEFELNEDRLKRLTTIRK